MPLSGGYLVGMSLAATALLIVHHGLDGAVVRVAVDDDVLHMGIVLLLHALKGALDDIDRIIGDRGYGDFGIGGAHDSLPPIRLR